MGGERETVSPQKVVEKGETKVIGSVRYHEQGGEIHFHDDENKLKVAVPAATWMAAFQDMMASLPAKRQFVDAERGTALLVKMSVKPKKPKKDEIPRMVTTLRVTKVEVDEESAALNKFTYGK